MKETLTIILISLSFSFFANAQAYTIRGYVFDDASRESLINALILDTLSSQSTIANEYGFFSITLPKGKRVLKCSYVGYEPLFITLDITTNQSLDFNLKNLTLETVVVKANAQIGQRTQMSEVSLPIKLVEQIPQLGGEPDILKAFSLLPGISNNGEGSTGLIVRGGGRDQNLVLLDDAVIYNTAHLFGFLSTFNSDALQYARLIKGGFPARYGGRLSSIVDVRMREGNKQEFKGKFGIGLTNSKLTYEGPISKKASFILSTRASYLQAFTFFQKQAFNNGNADYYGNYFMYDLNAKVNYTFSENTKIFLSFYTGKDHYESTDRFSSFEILNLASEQINWNNISGTLRLTHQTNPKFFSKFSLAFSKYAYQLASNKKVFGISQSSLFDDLLRNTSFTNQSNIQSVNTKAYFDFIPNSNHYIKFGGDVHFHNYTPKNSQQEFTIEGISSSLNEQSELTKAIEYSLFVEDEIQFSNKISMNLGGRFSGFLVNDKNYVFFEPRLSSRFLLSTNTSFKASYSFMTQYMHLLDYSNIGPPNDIWVSSTDIIPPQTAHQMAIGLTKALDILDLNLSIEGYYKSMKNLIDYSDNAHTLLNTQSPWYEQIETGGTGKAWGIEFLLEKKEGNLTGFLGYTLAWNNRDFKTINRGRTYPFRYDRRHDIAINLSHKLGKKWSITTNWVFNSGLPFTLPTAKQFTTPDINREILIFERKHNARMPNYHRLDIGLTRKKTTKKGNLGTLNLSVYNAYSRFNPYYVYLEIFFRREQDGTISSYEPKIFQKSLFGLIPSVSYSLEF